MKADKKGCSTTAAGTEKYETYFSSVVKRTVVQYDYRHTDGELFSTIGNTIEICRTRRDAWLAGKES